MARRLRWICSPAAQRDQVYLSLCLALLSAASRHGVWLPLVLDDPFERLDARATAALAAVLEGFSRQGHQVLVFTRRKEAAERLAAVGAEVHDMMSLRQPPADALPAMVGDAPRAVRPSVAEAQEAKWRRTNCRSPTAKEEVGHVVARHGLDATRPQRRGVS